MGPYIQSRQKGSSTPKQVLPYRTSIFNQVVGDLESSGIILQSRSYTEEYQITHQNRIWCRKEKGLWIRFYSKDWTVDTWQRLKSTCVCVMFLRKISYVISMWSLKYCTGPNLINFIHNTLYLVINFYTPQENLRNHQQEDCRIFFNHRTALKSNEESSFNTMSHWNYLNTCRGSGCQW